MSESLAAAIDHTLLTADASADDVRRLCSEALRWRFAAVCVNPWWVPLAARLVEGSGVKVAAVCGFPLGANATSTKAVEARLALEQGAHEIDMVINLGAVRSSDWRSVESDVAAVVAQARPRGGLVKAILECGLFDNDDICESARRAVTAGVDFVKTSTGVLAGGAKVEHVALLRRTVAGAARVKASGGIRTLDQARAMLAAGADRLGTSSGVAIMEETVARGS